MSDKATVVSFDKDLWGAFALIEKRDASGTTTLSEMASQLDKYAALVEDFGTKCKSLWTKPSKCDEGGSMQGAWEQFRAGMEREAIEFHNRAAAYRSDVISPLKELAAQRKAQKAKLNTSTKNLNAEKKKASADLGSAKKKYMKKTEDHENAILAVARGEAAALAVNKITKLRAKAEKAEKDSQNLLAAYETCLSEFHTFQDQYEEGIRKNLLEWQEAEYTRMNAIKQRIEKFYLAHTDKYSTITSSFEGLRAAVDHIVVEDDVSKWVSTNKTASRPDAKAELELYVPKTDEFRNHLGGGKGKEAAAATTTAAAAVASTPAAGAGAAKPLVKATFDFAGTGDDGELLFKIGDIISVTSMLDENWWTGTLNGSEGMFPSNHVVPVTGTVEDLRKLVDTFGDAAEEAAKSEPKVEEPATENAGTATPAPDDGSDKGAAEEADEEVQTVEEKTKEAVEDAATAEEEGLQVKAKFKFEASSDDEVTILPGDVITIIEKVEEWYIGVNTRTNEEGMFPANYVEPV